MATTGVAQRNIDLTRKGYAAYNAGDADTVMNVLSDQVVWARVRQRSSCR